MPVKRKIIPPSVSKKTTNVCVLHVPDIEHGNFNAFSDLDNPQERLDFLKSIKEKRLKEPAGSPTQMLSVCSQIPDVQSEGQGYHRACYQRFTMNINRLAQASTSSVSSDSRHQRPVDRDKVLFAPDCIFCNKEGRIHVQVGKKRTTHGTTLFEKDGDKRVLDIAEKKKDDELLCRIRGYDLFACEAKYHPKCRKKYIPEVWQSKDADMRTSQVKLEEAHAAAFETVSTYLNKTVIEDHEIVKLSALQHMYIMKLGDSEFANPNYRAVKLKDRLMKHPRLGPELVFTMVTTDVPFTVLFSSRIDTEEVFGGLSDLPRVTILPMLHNTYEKHFFNHFVTPKRLYGHLRHWL